MKPVALDALNPQGRLRSLMAGNPYFRLSTTLREAGLRPSTCLRQLYLLLSAPRLRAYKSAKPQGRAGSPPHCLLCLLPDCASYPFTIKNLATETVRLFWSR
ncbi:hypothetical protein QUB80_13380 [Chlorogloeopsis sp. ULAP01]|nr:hypothetical protein [Chlorogloeopsis sp. ULAP01]